MRDAAPKYSLSRTVRRRRSGFRRGGMLCRIDLLIASLILVAPMAQAQTAERPLWKAGYKWAYHQVGGLPPVESDWSREVTESLANGTFSVRTNTGSTLVFDGETNSLDPRGPEYSWKRFSFPLSVGKRWTYSRRLASGPRDGNEKATWEVKAYERLAVPAGAFDCFRVEGVVWQTWTQAIYGPSSGHEDATYWYCPEVKWVAKWKSHRAASQYAPHIDFESVLTSFSAAD